MESWFTVTTIEPDTFAVSEYRHWEEPHSYLLCGRNRALLIDTGLGVADIGAIVRKRTDLPVTVALTHAHWDHIGGLSCFPDFAVHAADASWLMDRFPLSLAEVRQSLIRQPCAFPKEFDVESYRLFCGAPTRLLHDGDVFDLGGRTVQVVHTPGHSPGHCCFYEPARRTMYTGDCLYRGTLYVDFPSTDPQQFFASLQKLQRYAIDRILPGHHALNVPVTLLSEAAEGFEKLYRRGLLHHGSGRFSFSDLSIYL